MARGTQLTELRKMLRAEAGHSTLVSAGVDNLPALDQKLRRAQQMLNDDYDWPYMQIKPYLDINEGQRYYDLSEMALEAIDGVVLWYNQQPRKIERGIGPAQYQQYNSQLDERSSPIRNWDIVSTGSITSTDANLEQLEVWPLPDVNDMQLQFYGKRRLRPLIADADVCDHDDLAIVLIAATDILASQEDPSAKRVEAAANRRIQQMRGRTKGGTVTGSMGTTSRPQSMLGRPIIRVQ
jgi:hypothetical protein